MMLAGASSRGSMLERDHSCGHGRVLRGTLQGIFARTRVNGFAWIDARKPTP